MENKILNLLEEYLFKDYIFNRQLKIENIIISDTIINLIVSDTNGIKTCCSYKKNDEIKSILNKGL